MGSVRIAIFGAMGVDWFSAKIAIHRFNKLHQVPGYAWNAVRALEKDSDDKIVGRNFHSLCRKFGTA